MSSNKKTIDKNFLIQFSSLLVLIVIALVILYDIPKNKKPYKSKFLISLYEIEGDINSLKIRKRVEKSEIILAEKEIVKKLKLIKVDMPKKRDKINNKIQPACESIIHIESAVTKKKNRFENSKKSYFTRYKKRFNKTYDYKLALKLSKLYFSKKRYKQSLKWSIIANELNDSDENSWIMFAKSKVKLGDKLSARSALVTYYKAYKSKKVKELLKGINS